MPEKESIAIFGAGKIGRSFIGQLFGNAGYDVVFVDVDDQLIRALNEQGAYKVIIKGDREEVMEISGVRAVHGTDREAVASVVYDAGILAVSVGKNALQRVVPLIAEGLVYRRERGKTGPLDIILAENMRSAAAFFRTELKAALPEDFPVDNIGLVETSIGKMVPIMTRADIEEDLLQVFAEPYNTLILDARGFRGTVPDVDGLAPKDNIRAWVDRKAFIHNMGHATAAYCGHYHHHGARYLYDVMEDSKVREFTRTVMLQAADVLQARYPEDFTLEALEAHIDDLLHRFRNKALKDTIYRVGHDLPRKLGPDDRFMGIIRMARGLGLAFDKIVRAMVYGYFFDARDEEGQLFPPDLHFRRMLNDDLPATLREVSGIDPGTDGDMLQAIVQIYTELSVKHGNGG